MKLEEAVRVLKIYNDDLDVVRDDQINPPQRLGSVGELRRTIEGAPGSIPFLLAEGNGRYAHVTDVIQFGEAVILHVQPVTTAESRLV